MRQDGDVPTHVALLRGINLAGRNKVAMADLREVVAALGHADVATYIQSGNVVFTTPKRGAAALAAEMERAIADRLGVRCRVAVLSRSELARAVAQNPYAAESDLKRVHGIFLTGAADEELTKRVAQAQAQAAAKGGRDEARVLGRTIYLHTPDGYGRSELAALLMRLGNGSATGVQGTARNWATVTKLLAMCEA
jgi:uncharacterized protein (DUF1697 family)